MATKTKNPWSILYLRPDGWWVAGTGFKDQKEANECAREQLPDHVTWRSIEASIVKADKEGKVKNTEEIGYDD